MKTLINAQYVDHKFLVNQNYMGLLRTDAKI